MENFNSLITVHDGLDNANSNGSFFLLKQKTDVSKI